MVKSIDLEKTALGIELGSTRIKAELLGEDLSVIASSSFGWESRLEGGMWSYGIDEIWNGMREVWAGLKKSVAERYGAELTTVGSFGVSAMMHGYLAFNEKGELLVPFRTWQNTCTGEAAKKLSDLFDFNIPQRWSVSHLYQAVLNGEEHVDKIAYVCTLAGYVHYMLTGERVAGIGDASGMFPIDSSTFDYDKKMVGLFDALDKPGLNKPLKTLFPKVLRAGEPAGTLTEEGAKLLDPSGVLKPGVPMCPPEGDAGTGMTATNAVEPETGNVSAGTSVFAMIVLDRPLSRRYEEIDMVTTPTGHPVAMVHCINCTQDMNEWAELFSEYECMMGHSETDKGEAFTILYKAALDADPLCGGITVCGYKGGEHIMGFTEGRPVIVRGKESRFTLPNLMCAHIYSSVAALAIGMDIIKNENAEIKSITGHGGLFKTKGVAQKILAAALGCAVNVMDTAAEGGAWGMALLAAYMKHTDVSLERFLKNTVFADAETITELPEENRVRDFAGYLERYKRIMPVERAAVENL